jgi:Sigma-70, region 4
MVAVPSTTRTNHTAMHTSTVAPEATDSDSAIADVEHGLREKKQRYRNAANRLTARERLIIQRRFGLDGKPPSTLLELARRNGMSPEAVRAFEFRGLSRIAELCEVEDDRVGASAVSRVARGLMLGVRQRALRRIQAASHRRHGHRRASAARPIRRRGSRRGTATRTGARGDPDLDEPPSQSPLLIGGGR